MHRFGFAISNRIYITYGLRSTAAGTPLSRNRPYGQESTGSQESFECAQEGWRRPLARQGDTAGRGGQKKGRIPKEKSHFARRAQGGRYGEENCQKTSASSKAGTGFQVSTFCCEAESEAAEAGWKR
jgi:hypothetical protein